MMSVTNIASTNRNPGIVPPWLSTPSPARNPGIVPPHLQFPIKILPIELPEQEYHILPIAEEIYTILPFDGETQFVSESVDASPASLADALRGR
ncbi:MAG: hypothetical protein ABI200_03980 [Gaiellales bacterium]